MACILWIPVLLWVVIDRVGGTEICSTSGFNFRYCDDDHYCCDDGSSCCSKVILGVGAIIGIVVGCIFFLSICIGIICCIAQSQKRPGRVIQPATGGQTIAVVGLQSTHHQTSYQQSPAFQPGQAYPAAPFQPGQAYQPPPPAYNNTMQPGPAYPPVMGSNTYQSDGNIMPAKQ